MIPYRLVRTNTISILTIRRVPFNVSVAEIEIKVRSNEFGDYRTVALEGLRLLVSSETHFMLSVFVDRNHSVAVNIVCGRSKSVNIFQKAIQVES